MNGLGSFEPGLRCRAKKAWVSAAETARQQAEHGTYGRVAVGTNHLLEVLVSGEKEGVAFGQLIPVLSLGPAQAAMIGRQLLLDHPQPIPRRLKLILRLPQRPRALVKLVRQAQPGLGLSCELSVEVLDLRVQGGEGHVALAHGLGLLVGILPGPAQLLVEPAEVALEPVELELEREAVVCGVFALARERALDPVEGVLKGLDVLLPHDEHLLDVLRVLLGSARVLQATKIPVSTGPRDACGPRLLTLSFDSNCLRQVASSSLFCLLNSAVSWSRSSSSFLSARIIVSTSSSNLRRVSRSCLLAFSSSSILAMRPSTLSRWWRASASALSRSILASFRLALAPSSF